MRWQSRFSILAVLLATFATPVFATDVPLVNWPVPHSGGIRTLADVGSPSIFVGLEPCRIVDTRGGAPLGGGAMAASTPRNYTLTGNCGLLAGAESASLNITVTSTAGAGYVSIWPQGGTQPVVSTLNYVGGQTIANAAIVPLSATGSVTVVCMNAGAHLIIDVNGYYMGGSTPHNTGQRLYVRGTYTGGGMIRGSNISTTSGDGGFFDTAGLSDGASGVYGSAGGATGQTYGVFGISYSSSDGAAGVFGRAAGVSFPNNAYVNPAGVLGNGEFWGVLGKATTGRGVQGSRVDATTGTTVEAGVLGYNAWGVYSFGDIGASGTKNFVEPHPSDASRQIVYVALEGPEAGTYFRGRGRFVGRSAVIDVPEDFRLVTEEEGLTVQVTPIGGAAAVGVVSMDLRGIVVESTKDLEFSYLVQGFRRNYRQHHPIQPNTAFVPSSANARMDPYPAHIQARLVELGIYNADGTVNLPTAERMGWAQTWREEAAARSAATAREALRQKSIQ